MFLEAINADLNMPEAVAAVWKMLDDKNLNNKKKYELMMKFDAVLGLGLDKGAKEEVSELSEGVKNLVQKREKLRGEKKFEESDAVREKIEKMGYTVKDSKL